METKDFKVWWYTLTALVGIIAGGAIVFAITSVRSEDEQARFQRDTLNSDIQVFRQRIGPLREEVKTLQERVTSLKSEIERLTATLADKERTGAKTSGEPGDRNRALAELEDRNRTLVTQNEALKKTLAGLGEKADAAATEREALARKLGATGRTLEQAQARAAELNKSYEALLTEKSSLAEREAARRAELETTKKAFEEAQSEVSRLMGARGIYTVQTGDSLSTIAAFFYRDGLRWPDIFKANGFLISHPDLIYPKQVLIIPH